MSNSAVRFSLVVLAVLALVAGAASQTASKPMRAIEVMALQAGGALPENIAREVNTRGLSFHPDADYIAQIKKAGADTALLSSLQNAKVMGTSDSETRDEESLQHLSNAA